MPQGAYERHLRDGQGRGGWVVGVSQTGVVPASMQVPLRLDGA